MESKTRTTRQQYLEELAEDFGVPKEMVFEIAALLGPNEDYDGLVTTIADYIDREEDY